MRIFFLSEKTCALSIGGAYLGIIDGFERSVELDPADSLLLEVCPFGDFLPVRFALNDNFLIHPPEHVKLYFSQNFLAIYFCDFLRADQSLKILWQKRFQKTLLTLALQGKLQLYFESAVSKILSLPDALLECSVEETPIGFLLSAPTAFALVSFEGELLVQSEGKVLNCEQTLKAEIPFHDCLAHSALCEWDGKILVSCSIRSAFEPNESTFALALFESALIGADCSPFLADNLAPKASALKEYLGEYCSVVLTPARDIVGLVYPRKDRIFDVRYFMVTLTDGKISNIMPAEKAPNLAPER